MSSFDSTIEIFWNSLELIPIILICFRRTTIRRLTIIKVMKTVLAAINATLADSTCSNNEGVLEEEYGMDHVIMIYEMYVPVEGFAYEY